jgi:thiamine biosynthesis lipoprotein
MHYHEFPAMSTSVLMAAEGPYEAVETGFAEARAFVAAAEKRFTRFSEESELSRLNRAAGTWFEASPDLYEVVALALELYDQTGGLFDPGVLDALEEAGYDRTIEELRQYGAPGAVQVLARPRTARFGNVRLDPLRKRIRLPDELRIDLGGIAKGWIAGRAAHVLSRWSKACAVDAGGDVFLYGLPKGENCWRVSLEDPANPTRTLAMLKLPPGAVATSAVTKRRWQQNGKERHHLIDPRTRQPSQSAWQSVTAIAPTAPEAEVFAKALLIGGPREVSRISRLESGIEFIAVDHNGKLWGSKHTRELIDV